jgi:hypothetical protein
MRQKRVKMLTNGTNNSKHTAVATHQLFIDRVSARRLTSNPMYIAP